MKSSGLELISGPSMWRFAVLACLVASSAGQSCPTVQDYQVLHRGVTQFSISASSGECSCANGFVTNGNVTAASINAAGAVSTSSLQVPVFESTQPTSRFSSSAASGWTYTGESLSVALTSARRLRFSLRQMVSNGDAGNLAYALGVSDNAGTYVKACDSPTPQGVAAPVSTTSAEWYCNVPSGTHTFYVFVNVLAGGGNWAVANEAPAGRSYCDFRAAAN